MKPTEQAVRDAAKDIASKIIPLSELESQIHQQLVYDGANWAISQMQPELTTLKRHDEQLRIWINSMTVEIKVLREALIDVKCLANDEELTEWLFDNDYVTPQPPTK